MQISGLVDDELSGAACGRWTLSIQPHRSRNGRWRCALERDERVRILPSSDGQPAPTVMTPATARNVIAVGAYIHGRRNRMAAFSGAGVSDAGHAKPDLVAPGVNVGAISGREPSMPDPCHAFKAAMGTSVATAITSGVCALELQRAPNQDHRTLRERLRRTAIADVVGAPAGCGRLHGLVSNNIGRKDTDMNKQIAMIQDQQQLLGGGYIIKHEGVERAYIFVEDLMAVVDGVETKIGIVESWALTSSWQGMIDEAADSEIALTFDHDAERWSDFAAFASSMSENEIEDYVECRCITRSFS
jgi:hypothetical protein